MYDHGREESIEMIRPHGAVGFLIMAAGTVLLCLNVEPVPMFYTPIMWWGYVLFADSLVEKLRGSSLITGQPRTFAVMVPVSIICWLLFEAYNVRLGNWEYINMSDSFAVRVIGYILSFSTITPGIYETAHLGRAAFFPDGLPWRSISFSRRTENIMMAAGAVLMIVPLVVPRHIAAYLFGLVWIGVIPLVDPVNRKLGTRSIMDELERGRWATFASLVFSGIACGFLWEFWNYWALTKWIYHIPFWSGVKIFEMPAVGFPGFIPFAFECFVMFNLCARLIGVEPARFPGTGATGAP
jgi:hypothetical protein